LLFVPGAFVFFNILWLTLLGLARAARPLGAPHIVAAE
jgi:hypothetical protein